MSKTTHITITAAPRKRKPQPQQGKEVRHGPFTRIDDDPLVVPTGPVLLVTTFVDPSLVCKAYDISTPASPKSPKTTAVAIGLMVARAKTVAFPNAQGYAFTYDGVDSKLEALNLSKPQKPVSTSFFVPTGGGFRLDVDEGLLFWHGGEGDTTISVADVSDPGAIALIHTYDMVADFTFKQRYMGSPSALNNRLYVCSAPNFFTAGGDGAAAYLATYNFDDPGAATQIDVITFDDGENNLPQLPPTVLGDGVVYTAYMNRNVDLTHTTRIRTYSLADPDAPVEVDSLAVATDPTPPVGFGATPGYAPRQLYINKSKTRLFLHTHPSPPVGDLIGALWMFDVSTPAAPTFLDSIPIEVPVYQSYLSLYAADTGYVYVGNPMTALIAVYNYSGGTFDLVNTLTAPADPLVALDKKGFPQ